MLLIDPLDEQNRLTSAKSHVIGIACILNVLTTSSFLGDELHVQIVEEASVTLSPPNARYVDKASA
jgi:hypothetical protein